MKILCCRALFCMSRDGRELRTGPVFTCKNKNLLVLYIGVRSV